jgi:predicted nucleotidyltransferase
MKRIDDICKKHGVSLCYIFGSQKETGKDLLEGKDIVPKDAESDIDFAVLFQADPHNNLEAYALLSLDLQDLVSPCKADLLFLHEVDHLTQLEAIKGFNVYSSSGELRETFEEQVMMFASDELEIFKLNERDFLAAIDDGYFEFEYKIDRR